MLLSTLLGSFLAAPTPLNDWKPCSTDPKDTLLCATLQVPLDYKTQKTIGVALIKYPAPKQPAKGSVLFNPGGPGGSGVSFIKYGGNSTSRVYFDDSMDLIGFDPRGVGKTIPLMCYNSTEELLAGALINRKYKFSATMTAAEHALAVKESELFAENCAAYSGGEYLNYLSTYYVAKDMDEIRKFVGSEMMNFVGFSYGTLLGATYANMFPEKVGRIILDGVLQPVIYTGPNQPLLERTYSDWLPSLQAFGKFCDEAKCALYSEKESTFERIVRILSQLKQKPLIFRSPTKTGLITYSKVSSQIQAGLNGPNSWSSLAQTLRMVDEQNLNELSSLVNGLTDLQKFKGGLGGFNGCYCADSFNVKMSAEALGKFIGDNDAKVHPLSITEGILPAILYCDNWKTANNIRYTGPWNKKFANPILLASTKYDPATPLASAIETLELMNQGGVNNAVLLQQDSVGHCTTAQESACTISAFREYMLHGKLPAPGSVCQPNVANPFIVKKGIAPSAFKRLQEELAKQRQFPF